MIKKIYSRAFTVLMRKPVKLWGLALLGTLIGAVGAALCGTVPIASAAVVMLLDMGLMLVLLHGYLGEEIHTAQLFEAFKDWNTIKRVVLGRLYTWMWVFLWLLIPIVGIIFAIKKAYAYRLVPYILALEPDVKITDACKVSEQRTTGYKAKMFWADFLWPFIVAAVIGVLAILSAIPYIGWLFTVVTALVVIAAYLLSTLFSGLIHTAFYVEIERQFPDAPQFDDSMNEPAPKAAPAYTASPDKKYCPNCGTANELSARFCIGCGSEFARPAQSESDNTAEE